MDREALERLVKLLCYYLKIVANIGLLMCCIVVSISILHKDIEMCMLTFYMVIFLIFTIHFCNYFKNYLD